jgi:tripartite-type tricarboxylate transporter receptor subunit TctC
MYALAIPSRLSRIMAAGAAVVLGCCLINPAAQAQYPARPVTGIIPFGTGGPSDIISRIVGTAMSKDMGQPIVMLNRPGVGGNLGIAAVAASKPDGYTLLFCSIATTQNPAIFRTLPYDPQELVAVAIFGDSPYLIGVSATNIPSRTLAEFIDLLKKNPGKYNIAGAGGQRMTMEKFMLQFGVKLEVINFKSAGDATTALMGGQVDLQLNNVTTLAPGAKGGTIRLLAVAGESRLKAIPTVPTTREAGFPEYVDKGYVGLYVRKGTPAEAVARLHESARRALGTPEVQQRFESLDYVPSQMTQPQADAFYRSEIARWKEVVRTANIPQVDE